jgi:ABC-type polysaccharide/polyol phosphate export permease
LFNILSQHLKVKYKRTILGYVWSLLNPLLQLIVLTAVFSHVPKLGMPNYTLYLFAGLMPWTFFMNAVMASSTSLLENESFIKKVYLPKVVFPLSKVLLMGVDFLFSLVAISLIGLAIGFRFHATVALLPLAILILAIFVTGVSMFVSVATVFFRDVQYLLSVFLNLVYFLTPILYPLSVLPEKYRTILAFNPLSVFIDLFHKLIYFGELPSMLEWSSASLLALTMFLGGLVVMIVADEELVFRM